MNTIYETNNSKIDCSFKYKGSMSLYDEKLFITCEKIKSYSPLNIELLWEMYDIICVVYEHPLSASVIHKVMNKKTKKVRALKELKKKKMREPFMHNFAKNECSLHYSMSKLHDSIVTLYHYFEDDKSYYMVMEFSNLHGYFEELLEKVRDFIKFYF